MDRPEDCSKALNEYMSSGFAPRADIVAACRHVRFVPEGDISSAASLVSIGASYCSRLAGEL
jgi:hypothetical protein